MKTKFNRTLAVLTAVLMLLCMLPAGVFAEGEDIPIDAEHFPDESFRSWVSEHCDTDGSGALSPGEIAAVTSIDVGVKNIAAVTNINVSLKNIADLTGIEYFTALTRLRCNDRQLTSLNVSQNTALEELYCDDNQLTSLDVSKNTALTALDCGCNQLTELDVSKNTALTQLYCYVTQLTSLDVSQNTALKDLNCQSNQLTSLDVSQNTALEWLYCDGNQLTSLDVSQNTALTQLGCSGNQLTSLDLSANTNLEDFYCWDNSYRVSSDPFDLTALPGNFDVSKASDWQGGTVESNILTFNPDETEVTYTYDCGNGKTAIFTLLAPESTPETVPGDYDCNGVVNVQDAILTLRAAMELITPSAQSLLNADMDGDGTLAVTDAITILRMAMELI